MCREKNQYSEYINQIGQFLNYNTPLIMEHDPQLWVESIIVSHNTTTITGMYNITKTKGFVKSSDGLIIPGICFMIMSPSSF